MAGDFLLLVGASPSRRSHLPGRGPPGLVQVSAGDSQPGGLTKPVLRPRIKIIPIFEMGMLPTPDSPTYITPQMMTGFDHSLLQCSTSRIATEDGVYSCPILVNEERALIGDSTLSGSLASCDLYHTACTTCYATGMTCKNY